MTRYKQTPAGSAMSRPSLVRAGAMPLKAKPFAVALTSMAILFLLASCAQMPTGGGQPSTPPPTPKPAPHLQAQETPPPAELLWEWNGSGRNISHIWIDVDSQRARFYDGADQIGWTFIASGLDTHPTPVGSFAVLERTSKKRSNLYGKIYNARGKVVKSDAKRGRDPIPSGGRFVGAKMPYFMRLTYDGIGMHAGRIPVPGFPASHGCIRMPKEVAPLVYNQVSRGTPVTITGGKGPDYGNYAERQRLARAAEIAAQAAPTESAAPAAPAAQTEPAAVTEPAALHIEPAAPAVLREPAASEARYVRNP